MSPGVWSGRIDHIFPGAGGSPALERPLGCEAGEDADQRDAAGRRDMPARRIVAYKEPAALNVSGESSERTIPQ